MKQKNILTILLSTLIMSSCYDGNKEAIEIGKQTYSDYKNVLSRIKPIFDEVITDSCQIFGLEMSSTTDLFFLNTEIDQFYDSTKYRQIPLDEENYIQSIRPREEITDILYLKGVYIAYGFEKLDHKSMYGGWLVDILDSNKFNYCYPKLKKYKSNFKEDKANWKYRLDDEWSIVCGGLIYSNQVEICNYLKNVK